MCHIPSAYATNEWTSFWSMSRTTRWVTSGLVTPATGFHEQSRSMSDADAASKRRESHYFFPRHWISPDWGALCPVRVEQKPTVQGKVIWRWYDVHRCGGEANVNHRSHTQAAIACAPRCFSARRIKYIYGSCLGVPFSGIIDMGEEAISSESEYWDRYL